MVDENHDTGSDRRTVDRRTLLSGIGVGVAAPVVGRDTGKERFGSVLFAEADLTYRFESGRPDDPLTYHIDKPPEFVIQNGSVVLTDFAVPRVRDWIQNGRPLLNFRGLKTFSRSVVENSSTELLTVSSGVRNQPTVGVSVDEPVDLPDFGVETAGDGSVRLRAFREATVIGPSEERTLAGSPTEVEVRRNRSNDPVKATVRPVLSVTNHGLRTAKGAERTE